MSDKEKKDSSTQKGQKRIREGFVPPPPPKKPLPPPPKEKK